MSWDATIYRFAGEPGPDAPRLTLGTVREVYSLIAGCATVAAWESDHVAYLDIRPDGTLRLELYTERYRSLLQAAYGDGRDPTEAEEAAVWAFRPAPDEPVTDVYVEARHGGDIADPLSAICTRGGWHLHDYQTGRYVSGPDMRAIDGSWGEFLGFVDRVKRDLGAD